MSNICVSKVIFLLFLWWVYEEGIFIHKEAFFMRFCEVWNEYVKDMMLQCYLLQMVCDMDEWGDSHTCKWAYVMMALPCVCLFMSFWWDDVMKLWWNMLRDGNRFVMMDYGYGGMISAYECYGYGGMIFAYERKVLWLKVCPRLFKKK